MRAKGGGEGCVELWVGLWIYPRCRLRKPGRGGEECVELWANLRT